MAEFSMLVTTIKGQELIAKMLSSEQKITFTRIVSSDTVYTVDGLEALEEITGIRQSSSVSKVSRINDVTVKVEAAFTNVELTEGYYMKTVALYALDEREEEILYAAAVETSGNCYVPAFGGITASGVYIQLSTTVSNAENVTVEVEDSVFATIGNINDLQEQIDIIRGQATWSVARCSLNSEKLSHLNGMGECVLEKELSCLKPSITYPGTIELGEITETELEKLDDQSYYLYILDEGQGNGLQFYDADDLKKELEGSLYLTLSLGMYQGTSSYVPITMINENIYAAPVQMVMMDGKPNGPISITANAKFFERADNGAEAITGNLYFSSRLRLRVHRIGYLIDNIADGNEDDSEIGAISATSYNALTDKPSINDIVLQGDLTSETLGLEGGSGSVTEMTYEETLAVLNEEETIE